MGGDGDGGKLSYETLGVGMLRKQWLVSHFLFGNESTCSYIVSCVCLGPAVGPQKMGSGATFVGMHIHDLGAGHRNWTYQSASL